MTAESDPSLKSRKSSYVVVPETDSMYTSFYRIRSAVGRGVHQGVEDGGMVPLVWGEVAAAATSELADCIRVHPEAAGEAQVALQVSCGSLRTRTVHDEQNVW